MKQLLLDLHANQPPTLENFVRGDNAELLAHLAALASVPHHLYLWGKNGSGRSHLLHATAARFREQGRTAFVIQAEAVTSLPEDHGALLAIDDIERLDPSAQIALFNAFNRACMHQQCLLLAGPCAPQRLELREDLRTRIGQCLIFEARPLDDAARAAILRSLATRRGVHLADEVIDFMLNHGRRDLPSMLSAFNALDATSLEQHRPITLPLLRTLMRQGLSL
ncbi:MAG: DnaA regulatory inactivator Hda [Azoarcus sp.]|jgi:DnaA family protein|nr:DnaA regulatory inactivator Hda [Azoarcus sp.]